MIKTFKGLRTVKQLALCSGMIAVTAVGSFSSVFFTGARCAAQELSCTVINYDSHSITDSDLYDFVKDTYACDHHVVLNSYQLEDRVNTVAQEALAKFTLIDSQTKVFDRADVNNARVLIDNHIGSNALNCVAKVLEDSQDSMVTMGADSNLVAHSNNAQAMAMAKASNSSYQRLANMAHQSLGAVTNLQSVDDPYKFANIKLIDAPLIDNLEYTKGAYQSIEHLKGLELNASTLQNMLDLLSEYYQSHGYVLSRAYLPEQNIEHGLVQVLVANPKFNHFTIENKSLVSDDYIEYLLSGITNLSGEYVTQTELDNRIRKLADLGTFSMFGEAHNADPHGLYQDVDFIVGPSQDRFSFALFADNQGNKSAGRYRFGGLMEIQSPTGSADRLLLSYARSNEKQNNYSLSYRLPINSHPTSLGLDVCYSDYELSGIYRELGAQGTSLSVEAYVIEPVLRSSDTMFNLKAGVRYRKLEDEYANFDLKFKKHTWSAYVGADGFEHLGKFLIDYEGKGSMTHVYCDDEFMAVPERTYLTLEGKAGFGYSFSQEWYARTGVTFQIANRPLDGADTFLAGGDTGLRAYEFGDISGDGGVIWHNEVKYFPKELPEFSFVAHIEKAKVYSHNDLAESGASAGFTTNYQYQGFKAELDLSHGLGQMPQYALNSSSVKFSVVYSF